MRKIDKICVLGTICIIVVVFGVYIGNKIFNNYQSNVMLVNKKRIVEAAKQCVDEDKCNSEIIYLRDLYNNKYLSEESNPISREVYSYNSYIKLVNGEYVFFDLY